MTTKYFALLTNQGAAILANAAALGTKVNITAMAVGDGGGTLPTPDASQTKLVGEKRRAQLNSLIIDTANSSQIIAEQVIPEGEGGFWIREIGLFDADGVMIAVANCAETYKPMLAEGSGRTQTVRMIIIVNSTTAVTLKIDPAVVLATRKYVDDAVIEVKAYADSLMDAHLKAADPHTQYAPKASPTFTGKPKAPTAAAGDDSTQLATTAFVAAALSVLNGGAPASLDTLKELAAAMGNDPKFVTTMTTALTGKMDIAKNGSDIADVAAFLRNLGLGEGAKMPAASALASSAGWLSIPVIISGVARNMILQWKAVSVPMSVDGSMQSVNSAWPVAFPTACLITIQALTNSLIYSTNGSPFTSSTVIDRASFAAASAYSKSTSTVTVWGVGY
ncbi:phage tail protein [Pantoea trifolii]|uniref:Phage tail protein n=1 Tax=Pantoea trifolii TaxID=2968030 RepID=A0ABT1VNI7_9GAMM|nr:MULTISPECIES: phage tail protein [unclassified Pantoea]MCQ8229094.1 phage tail protein [Pantoea sp. MMK2]MCQ8237268.1 phage tail protein [Pantoea sp. MMK3]